MKKLQAESMMKSLTIIAAIASVILGADLPINNEGGRLLDDERRLEDESVGPDMSKNVDVGDDIGYRRLAKDKDHEYMEVQPCGEAMKCGRTLEDEEEREDGELVYDHGRGLEDEG